MILSLEVKNFALIEHSKMEFAAGLNIITGETGAGKSILLGALGLIMGDRLDTKSIINNDERCIIEGTFDIKRYGLNAFFDENDLVYDDQTIIRREISPSGKSRSFINDSPCTLKQVSDLTDQLVDIHQQFDTLAITNESFQFAIIDAFAKNQKLLSAYQKDFNKYLGLQRRLKALEEKANEGLERKDYLQFITEEYDDIGLRANEVEELEAIVSLSENKEKIIENLGELINLLDYGDHTLLSALKKIHNSLNQIDHQDKFLMDTVKRIDELIVEADDLSNTVSHKIDDYNDGDIDLEDAEEKLNTINKLFIKHRVESQSELEDKIEEFRNEFDKIESDFSEIEVLHENIKELESELITLANQIGINRKNVLKSFENQIKKDLAHLKMENAIFKVDLKTDKLNIHGNQTVQFLFSANPGFDVQEIKKVASGGEKSRLALVIQSLVASQMALPTIIFDEIDSGVSGDIAGKMGEMLKSGSKSYQIIVITHSAQVAAKADKHFFVHKEVIDGNTRSQISVLSAKDRINQIAIMLSSDPPTTNAIKNAKDLINA